MQVIRADKLHEFGERHASARPAIRNWLRSVTGSQWKTFAEVKATYPSADYVKGFIVFNLGGNNYRVVAVAKYPEGQLFIRKVMTHAEYDRWKA